MEGGTFKCKNCGAILDLRNAVDGVICCSEYCHSIFTVPKKETSPAALDFLRTGEHELDTGAFERAYEAYAKAAEADGSEPEAYFGMALAAFKVRYIRDVKNNRLQAICYDVSDKSFRRDANYRKALQLSTASQRAEYDKKAQDIDYIRDEFYSIRETGVRYDCFLCVKVSDENGGNTQDCMEAMRIYHYLKDKGYSPFFSEEEIRSRAGVDYEALILYALQTAECMLVVCSDESYLRTPWVKNEYMRFLALIGDEQKESDAISIAFRGTPIEKLEGKRGKIQGIDLRRPDGYSRIESFVESHTPEARARKEEEARQRKAAEETRRKLLDEQLAEVKRQQEQRKAEEEARQKLLDEQLAAVKQQQEQIAKEWEQKLKNAQSPTVAVQTGAGVTATSLCKRATQFAEDGDYKSAVAYFNRALDADPECGDAWWGLFTAERGVADVDAILHAANTCAAVEALPQDKNYKNAKKYTNAALQRKIAEFDSHSQARCEQIREEIRRQQLLAQEQARIAAEQAAEQKRIAEEQARIAAEKAIFPIENGVLTKYCGHDSHVVIPNGVTRIGNGVFSGYARILHITIPDGVKIIGDNAFAGCIGVTRIDIPNSVTNIGSGAFRACTSLTEIVIPNSVTNIGAGAFRGCNRLTSVTLSNSLASIGTDLFSECSGLASIRLPNSVQNIGDGAFSSCVRLKDIEIPSSVINIGNHAFSGCTCVTRIDIPNSVTNIGKGAFCDCNSLTNIDISGRITSIGDDTFSACSSLTSVTLPSSVTSIGAYAFFNCNSLASIEIPSGVMSIGAYAFNGCSGLTSVTLPNSLTSIGSYAFTACRKLASIEIPSSVTSIGNNAFYVCGRLASIKIPSGVMRIGEYAFARCGGLTSVTIANGVTGIEEGAFSECEMLKSIEIPDSVKEIGHSAFAACINLTSIEIPSSVIGLGGLVFDGCNSLQRVTISKKWKEEMKSAFHQDQSVSLKEYKKIKFTFTK